MYMFKTYFTVRHIRNSIIFSENVKITKPKRHKYGFFTTILIDSTHEYVLSYVDTFIMVSDENNQSNMSYANDFHGSVPG